MKRIITLFAVVLFVVGLFSCRSSPPTPVQSGSSVWKISKNDNSLFLGGSIHVLRAKDFPLPKEFDRAFSQSKMLVLEADIEQMENDEITQYLSNQMFLPGGQTLQSILDSDTYDLLETTCAEYGFSIDAVFNLKPSMVVTMLSMLQIQEFGFVQQGVDIYYLDQAHQANKPVGFLETIEFQIDMIVSMGEGYENDFVR
jgi:uncharacterized protein YbaP (TraB family)